MAVLLFDRRWWQTRCRRRCPETVTWRDRFARLAGSEYDRDVVPVGKVGSLPRQQHTPSIRLECQGVTCELLPKAPRRGTLLIKAGIPVKVVSERLGHSNPAFTIDTYQHILPGMQAEAARLFESLVASAGSTGMGR